MAHPHPHKPTTTPHVVVVQPDLPRWLFVLPFAVLAISALALRPSADVRTWSVLVAGLLVLLAMAAVGPLQGSDATGRYAAARRVLLRALCATMMLFSLCCAFIAAQGLDGTLDVWPGIIFVPGWFLFALLIPLWMDSPAIRTSAPETGWKSVGGFKLVYCDPDEDALWVYMEPQLVRDYWSALYTPNLGHRWGRAVMATFAVLIVAMIAMLVATSRVRGLLP